MIGKIHIAKNKLAIDDNTYREMLHNLTGKSSCKDLNFTELSAVIKHLENCGLNPEQPKINKIYSLWYELYSEKLVKNKNLTACRSYVQKQAKKSIYDCTSNELSNIIEQLKKWLNRATTTVVNDTNDTKSSYEDKAKLC